MKRIIVILLFVATNLIASVESAIEKFKTEPLTIENVAKAIIEMEIKYPEYVLKQTIKESGWVNKEVYKSKLAVECNNIFGMRKPRQRMTTALDKEYSGYATYSYWIYSVVDYLYWQQMKPIKDGESYPAYLVRRGYARNTKGYVKTFNQYKLPENILNLLEQKDVTKNQNMVFKPKTRNQIMVKEKRFNDNNDLRFSMVFRFREINNGYCCYGGIIHKFRYFTIRNSNMGFYKNKFYKARRYFGSRWHIKVNNDSYCCLRN